MRILESFPVVGFGEDKDYDEEASIEEAQNWADSVSKIGDSFIGDDPAVDINNNNDNGGETTTILTPEQVEELQEEGVKITYIDNSNNNNYNNPYVPGLPGDINNNDSNNYNNNNFGVAGAAQNINLDGFTPEQIQQMQQQGVKINYQPPADPANDTDQEDSPTLTDFLDQEIDDLLGEQGELVVESQSNIVEEVDEVEDNASDTGDGGDDPNVAGHNENREPTLLDWMNQEAAHVVNEKQGLTDNDNEDEVVNNEEVNSSPLQDLDTSTIVNGEGVDGIPPSPNNNIQGGDAVVLSPEGEEDPSALINAESPLQDLDTSSIVHDDNWEPQDVTPNVGDPSLGDKDKEQDKDKNDNDEEDEPTLSDFLNQEVTELIGGAKDIPPEGIDQNEAFTNNNGTDDEEDQDDVKPTLMDYIGQEINRYSGDNNNNSTKPTNVDKAGIIGDDEGDDDIDVSGSDAVDTTNEGETISDEFVDYDEDMQIQSNFTDTNFEGFETNSTNIEQDANDAADDEYLDNDDDQDEILDDQDGTLDDQDEDVDDDDQDEDLDDDDDQDEDLDDDDDQDEDLDDDDDQDEDLDDGDQDEIFDDQDEDLDDDDQDEDLDDDDQDEDLDDDDDQDEDLDDDDQDEDLDDDQDEDLDDDDQDEDLDDDDQDENDDDDDDDDDEDSNQQQAGIDQANDDQDDVSPNGGGYDGGSGILTKEDDDNYVRQTLPPENTPPTKNNDNNNNNIITSTKFPFLGNDDACEEDATSLVCQIESQPLYITGGFGSLVVLLILCLCCRCCCCRSKSKKDTRGEYRAVAAQYGNMGFDNAFSDDVSSTGSGIDESDDDLEGGDWNGNKRVLEMGSVRTNGGGKLSLEEMNG